MLMIEDTITSYKSMSEVDNVSFKVCQLPKDIIYATVVSAISQSKADVAGVINFWLSAIAKTKMATDLIIVMESIIIADIVLNSVKYYNFLINHNTNRVLTIDNVLDKGFSLILINNYARAKIDKNYQIEEHLQQPVKMAIEQFKIELDKTICINKVDIIKTVSKTDDSSSLDRIEKVDTDVVTIDKVDKIEKLNTDVVAINSSIDS